MGSENALNYDSYLYSNKNFTKIHSNFNNIKKSAYCITYIV